MGTESDDDVADFTRLDGIGHKTAEALVEAGITTMSGLATSNVYELAERLAGQGSPVPTGRIISQRWLFQALEIETAGTDAADETQTAGHGADDGESAEDEGGNRSRDLEWVEQASFIVSFDRRDGTDGTEWQTRIWDTKGMVEHVVDGVDAKDWAAIIADSSTG